MHDSGRQLEAATPRSRQFGLATMLGLLLIAAIDFALARYLGLGNLARRYVSAFRRSPGYSTTNFAIYVLVVWSVLIFFRRQILETRPTWPLNGAFFGTICGATLFGATLAYALLCAQNPLACFAAIGCVGLCGAGWGVLPTVLVRVCAEPWARRMHDPFPAKAVGAAMGAAAGYIAVVPVMFLSLGTFLVAGMVPALFGAVCGARGAYVQAVVHGDRTYLPPQFSKDCGGG